MKLALTLFAVLTALLEAVAADRPPSGSERWHVSAAPEAISEQIQFSSGNVHLVGTVYLPKTGDHLPAVVVLHPAGADTREAGVFRHLREGLPALGFAVLIYDRRGSGQSSGNFRNSDFEALADDAIAGQRALGRLSRIDSSRIGFWGLSQGGWIAVLAAAHSRHTAFAISVSAPLVNPEEQMEFAMSNLLALRGYSQSDIEQMLAARKAWTGYIHQQNSRDVAIDALRKAETQSWFSLAYLPRAADLTTDPEHDATRRIQDYDPMSAVRPIHGSR